MFQNFLLYILFGVILFPDHQNWTPCSRKPNSIREKESLGFQRKKTTKTERYANSNQNSTLSNTILAECSLCTLAMRIFRKSQYFRRVNWLFHFLTLETSEAIYISFLFCSKFIFYYFKSYLISEEVKFLVLCFYLKSSLRRQTFFEVVFV